MGEGAFWLDRTAGLPRERAESLYLRYYDRIFRQALLIVGNPDCAAEVTQEVFLRAFEQYESLEDPDKFPAWIGAIAANLARDSVRAKWRELPSDVDLLVEVDLRGSTLDPEESVGRMQDLCDVREAVRKLPIDSRAVVVMYYLQEQSVGAIATALGIPEGTVKSRLYHARSRLRQFVREDR